MKRITIDLDPTHDATHGGQQLSFFNWHYDSWCYLPLAGFLSFDNEPDQYLFCCVLRAGNAVAKTGCLSILKRLLPRLRKAFRKAKIRIRLDAGFTGPELYDFFEAERLEYVVCMGKNPVLQRFAEPLMAPLREALGRCTSSPALANASTVQSQLEVGRDHQSRYRLHPGRKPKDNPRCHLP